METPTTLSPETRVCVGKGKTVWLVKETLDGGLVNLTKEGSKGYVNTTVDASRLVAAPQ